MQDILKQLKDLDGQVTSQIIKDIIEEHAPTARKQKELYERYKASDVPIFKREFQDPSKINNKLNNSFDSEIVDTKVGYFIGVPIAYQIDEEQENYDKLVDALQDFNIRNNIEDLDSESVKMASICGLGARLLYIDFEGKEKVMNVDPWECVFIYDRSIDEPQFAMRYYPVTVNDGKTKSQRTRVEWYDDISVTFYLEGQNGEFVLDRTEPINPVPHLFNGVPLVPFLNNEEMQGDCEKVLKLIDAYDRTLSDINSEVEQFRLAYMAFKGGSPTLETIELAKRTGAFEVPEDGDIFFVTKDLNDTVIENHLNRLEDNIMRFGKSVNLTDKNFSSNLSGVAIRYKLMALENKARTMERKFTTGLRNQFKVLATAWQAKGLPLDYTNIYFQFTRNLPVNLLDEAQSNQLLKGLVSEKTRLSLLSFIDDPQYELERIEQEQPQINLDEIPEDIEE